MAFEPLSPLRPLAVEQIVTVHYFEYSSSYYFEGESHDFWEFLYVDKGELEVAAGSRLLRLGQGQIVFHAPGEFHALRCNGAVAPNLVVVSFRCTGADMEFFRGRVLALGEAGKTLLGRIVEEAGAAFSTPLDDPLTTGMTRRADAPFGAEELLVLSLEELLVRLVRRDEGEGRPGSALRAREELVERVVSYLEANVERSLTLSQVCRDNLVGRSRLQQRFREQTGGGVMEYFGALKIQAARRMIREGRRNFTEIAAALGYQSLHYFSRHFKKVSGMTPSEYARSVKRLADRHGRI